MATPHDIQQAIHIAKAAVMQAELAIRDSDKLLKEFPKRIRLIEETNEREQARIDKEIVKTVREMDTATLNLIRATE